MMCCCSRFCILKVFFREDSLDSEWPSLSKWDKNTEVSTCQTKTHLLPEQALLDDTFVDAATVVQTQRSA